MGRQSEPISGRSDGIRRVESDTAVVEPSRQPDERLAAEPVTESEPKPDDEVDEWGYESFPASDPPQH